MLPPRRVSRSRSRTVRRLPAPSALTSLFCYKPGMLSVGNASVVRMVAQVMINQANGLHGQQRASTSASHRRLRAGDYLQGQSHRRDGGRSRGSHERSAFAPARARRAQLGADLYCLMSISTSRWARRL